MTFFCLLVSNILPHCWFLTERSWAKVGEGRVAAQIGSIMSTTISGPDPGLMVIFLTVSIVTCNRVLKLVPVRQFDAHLAPD
jgi:hypothetical protein